MENVIDYKTQTRISNIMDNIELVFITHHIIGFIFIIVIIVVTKQYNPSNTCQILSENSSINRITDCEKFVVLKWNCILAMLHLPQRQMTNAS